MMNSDAFPKRPSVVSHILHTLAWILMCGGAFALPLFSVWAYRTIAAKKGEVLGATIKAVDEFQQAEPKIEHFDLEGAHTHLKNAYESLLFVEESMKGWNFVLKTVSPVIPSGKSYYFLSKAGLLVSKIGTILSDPLLGKSASQSRALQLELLKARLSEVRPFVKEARVAMEEVKEEDFDDGYKKDIQTLREKLAALDALIDPAIETVENLVVLLGNEKSARYLLLFQNTGEMRPTGGFVGSLALVDVYKGEVDKVIQPKGGSYDLHYGMFKTIRAPAPFRVLNSRWEIQDCNWFPDFRYSAKKCAWFVEDAFGVSVDGVVAINVDAVSELLRIIGPLTVPSYDVTIDAENFIPVTQVIVDGLKHTKEPKEFLAEVFPLLIERVFAHMEDEKGVFEIAALLGRAAERKDIMMYSFDSDIQKWLENRNWAGALRGEGDYLFVNTASVNGGKSDFDIHETIYYKVEEKDGHRYATAEVTREHVGEKFGDDASVSEVERHFNRLTVQPNLSYVRLYAPYGAKLISVEGDIFDPTFLKAQKSDLGDHGEEDPELGSIEQNPLIHEASGTRITQEFGKTVFGNYLKVEPGEFGRLVFIYELPERRESADPRLLVQKQSGKTDRLIVSYQGALLYDGDLERDFIIEQ